MKTGKAAYLSYPGAWPTRYTIDAKACLGPTCTKCAEVCPTKAIDLTQQPRTFELDVQAVIWQLGGSHTSLHD